MPTPIPSTYSSATALSPDGRGALACARLEWDDLGGPAQGLLRSAVRVRDGWRVDGGRRRDRKRLAERGLMGLASGLLTPLGLLVREAGTRTPRSGHAAA